MEEQQESQTQKEPRSDAGGGRGVSDLHKQKQLMEILAAAEEPPEVLSIYSEPLVPKPSLRGQMTSHLTSGQRTTGDTWRP